MGSLPLLLFDALFVLFAVIVYGASSAAAFYAASPLWGPSPLQRGVAVVVGYFVFLHAFVLVVGIVKRVVQPPLDEGLCKVGFNRRYFKWGLNSIFQGLFTTAFFDRQIHIIFYLRYLYYRAMGMKLPFNCIIGTRVVIRQAELIELGHRVVLGEMCGLYGHGSPDGKHHFQARIKVGDRVMVGAYSFVGPGVRIGDDAVVGTAAFLSHGVRIGEKASVGARAFLASDVHVPARARVLANAVVEAGTEMKEGETWGGHPATRLD